MGADVKLDHDDLRGLLWLQEMVYARLVRETLRRAIAAGQLPEGTRYLFRDQVEAAGEGVSIQHEVPATRDHRAANPYDVYMRVTEEYSLAEVMKLCMESE